MTATNHNIYTD